MSEWTKEERVEAARTLVDKILPRLPAKSVGAVVDAMTATGSRETFLARDVVTLQCEATALRAESAESDLSLLREENRWISVEESGPGEGVEVLCFDSRDGSIWIDFIESGFYAGPEWAGDGVGNPTHWRPIPSGPVDAKKDGSTSLPAQSLDLDRVS